ncbi:MAG: hypothetical protein Q8N45_03820 [Anaerolineales bacterium]|nr:hypothetical protein [Anaerolineales bacterium]
MRLQPAGNLARKANHAHGHPVGATGAILMTKLVYELQRRAARYGLQTMCIGHGMATATIIERI